MLPSVSGKKMGLIDSELVSVFGFSVLQLMELAGLFVALEAKKLCVGKNIVVLCGKGNNGGDGLVAARHLTNFGFNVSIVFPFNPSRLKKIPKHQLNICKKMNILVFNFEKEKFKINKLVSNSDLIIDALIGFNLNGNPKNNFASLINLANNSGKKILSIDVPSGLNSSTGKAFNPCIKANTTLALTLPKKGCLIKNGKKYCGKLKTAYISVPKQLFQKHKLKFNNWFYNNLIEEQ